MKFLLDIFYTFQGMEECIEGWTGQPNYIAVIGFGSFFETVPLVSI